MAELEMAFKNPKHEIRAKRPAGPIRNNSKMTKFQMFKTKSLRNLDFENLDLFRISKFGFRILNGAGPDRRVSL
jgi:hypothetical protein